MRLKNELVTHQIDNEYITVFTSDTRESFHGLLRMNATGKFILDCLNSETDINEDDILSKMQEVFSGDPCMMKEDIREVLTQLKLANAVID